MVDSVTLLGQDYDQSETVYVFCQGVVEYISVWCQHFAITPYSQIPLFLFTTELHKTIAGGIRAVSFHSDEYVCLISPAAFPTGFCCVKHSIDTVLNKVSNVSKYQVYHFNALSIGTSMPF